MLVNPQFVPKVVELRESTDANPTLTIRRGFAIFRQVVKICDADGGQLGYLKNKVFSLGIQPHPV